MTGRHPEDWILQALAAGSIASPAREELIIHVSQCARCKTVVANLSETTSPVGNALAPEPGLERTKASDPLIGQQVGEYRILERLGQGGMGVLYRGEQPVIGKPVAIKVLLPAIAEDQVLVQRMLGEAQAVNAVRHPNIVDIFSFGQLRDGRPYLVMELLEGKPLVLLLLEAGRLTIGQTLVVLTQSMAALEAAHAAGVIHRDVKPDNIFVNPRDDGWVVTLIDFGLAKRPGPTDKGLTAPGMVMGTPGYMAPEQVRGRETSAKTDIYAMGILAWALLTGRDPFGGGSIIEVMGRHLTTAAPPLGPLVPDLPLALETLVAQMLEKEPERRPTATEVRTALAQLSKAPAPKRARAPAPSEPAPSRGKTAAAVAAIATLGCALVFTGWWLNAQEPRHVPPPPEAQVRPVEMPVGPKQVVPEPAHAPVPPAPAIAVDPDTVTWRCSRVIAVGDLDRVHGNDSHVFVISIEAEPLVLVGAPNTKKGLKQIQAIHKALTGCLKSASTITATHVKSGNNTVMALRGIYAGVAVEAGALTVNQVP